MHVWEESDSGIVPMNHSNKDDNQSTESGEGRPLIKENTHQSSTYPTQSGERVSQGLAGGGEGTKENKRMKVTPFLHHLWAYLFRGLCFSTNRETPPPRHR